MGIRRFIYSAVISFLVFALFVVRRPLLGDNIILSVALCAEFCIMVICAAAIGADAIRVDRIQDAIEGLVYFTLLVLIAGILLKLVVTAIRAWVRHIPAGPWKFSPKKAPDSDIGTDFDLMSSRFASNEMLSRTGSMLHPS